MSTKKTKRMGRPRKLVDGSIAFNVRLPPHAWAELHARAEHQGIPMADLARDAISEWLTAVAVGQRPIAGGRPARIVGNVKKEEAL